MSKAERSARRIFRLPMEAGPAPAEVSQDADSPNARPGKWIVELNAVPPVPSGYVLFALSRAFRCLPPEESMSRISFANEFAPSVIAEGLPKDVAQTIAGNANDELNCFGHNPALMKFTASPDY